MKTKLNYTKLMDANPTEFGGMVNSIGQNIVFIEHPTQGDAYPIIVVCHELKIAFNSEFYDLVDMTEVQDYEPLIIGNELKMGFEIN